MRPALALLLLLVIPKSGYPQDAQKLIGKWNCIHDGNTESTLELTADRSLTFQIINGDRINGRYAPNGNQLGWPPAHSMSFRFEGETLILITQTGQITNCTRPPQRAMGQPDESYAWSLAMYHIKQKWSNAFANGGCVGAKVSGMPGMSFEQLQGFRPNARTEVLPLNQADRLNGIQYRARYHITSAASRYFENGAWSQWRPGFVDALMSANFDVGLFVEIRGDGSAMVNMFGTSGIVRRTAIPCTTMPN